MPFFPRVALERGRTNFHEIWNSGIFLKFDGTFQLCVKLDKNEVHFSCRTACVSACIFECELSSNQNVFVIKVADKMKRVPCKLSLSVSLTVFELK